MPASQERHESLRIAKKFDKFISLPNLHNWKVHGSDSLHRGRVLCLLRTKRFFLPDSLSSLKTRMATVTSHGFLVLYESIDKGLIIDLRAATHVQTECDKYKSKKVKYTRSHIKIRMPRGNIHLFVRDDEIPKWTAAILEAHVCMKKKVPIRKTDVQVQTTDNMPVTAIEDVEDEFAPTTSSNSGMITVIEKRTSSEESQIPSVRQGVIPVRSIRQKLEKEMTVNIEPKEEVKDQMYVSSLFVFHEGVPVGDEAVELEDLKAPVKREWWMRSLRC